MTFVTFLRNTTIVLLVLTVADGLNFLREVPYVSTHISLGFTCYEGIGQRSTH